MPRRSLRVSSNDSETQWPSRSLATRIGSIQRAQGGGGRATVGQADPQRRRGPGRGLRDHGVLHPQRPNARDEDLQRYRGTRTPRRHGAELPPQPHRSEPAHGLDAIIGIVSDYVASGHVAASILAGANAAARALDHLVIIGESEGTSDVEDRPRAHARTPGRRHHLRHPHDLGDLAPEGLRGHAGRAAQLRRHATPYPRPMPDDRGAAAVAAEAHVGRRAAPTASTSSARTRPPSVAGARLDGRATTTSGGRDGASRPGWRAVGGRRRVRRLVGVAWRWRSPQGVDLPQRPDRLGVYQALADRGLAIPDDVSVVSFDGSELAGWLRPTLASVALPFFEMGRGGRPDPDRPVRDDSVVMDMPPVLAGDSLSPPPRVYGQA